MAKEKDIILKYKKQIALISTILFGFGLIIILLNIFFITTIPAFPEDTGGGGGNLGIEVNLGNSENGMGDVQSDEISTPEISSKHSESQALSQEEDKILSDENGEEINSKKVEKKLKKDKKIVDKIDNKKVEKDNLYKEPTIDERAIYKKSNKVKNQGITGKPGDQGNPNGTIYSKNYKGNGGGGNGSGPGHGGGIGNGEGTGVGSGKGPGISFKLKDRSKKYLPEPKYDIQESGTVVVEIIVNRDGKVIKAKAGAKGTTTQSPVLWKRSEDAALRANFSSNSDAPDEQKGTVTYKYVLN